MKKSLEYRKEEGRSGVACDSTVIDPWLLLGSRRRVLSISEIKTESPQEGFSEKYCRFENEIRAQARSLFLVQGWLESIKSETPRKAEVTEFLYSELPIFCKRKERQGISSGGVAGSGAAPRFPRDVTHRT
eukprot:4216265-Pleurochrysis_carterae.AAC.1